jgi:hypothetical protein
MCCPPPLSPLHVHPQVVLLMRMLSPPGADPTKRSKDRVPHFLSKSVSSPGCAIKSYGENGFRACSVHGSYWPLPPPTLKAPPNNSILPDRFRCIVIVRPGLKSVHLFVCFVVWVGARLWKSFRRVLHVKAFYAFYRV